jgi:hypothetical protein
MSINTCWVTQQGCSDLSGDRVSGLHSRLGVCCFWVRVAAGLQWAFVIGFAGLWAMQTAGLRG